MAQRVNVVLVDDLDGSDADETVTFGLDGVDYEIDLNDKHAAALRDALALYVGHGRRTGGRRRRGQGAAQAARANGAAGAGGATPAEIRAWARDNGWEVPERGRVAAEVREAYDAAH
ncbi:histone-like nucleoid-structuring protein Lsr2 [Nocardioides iriomotensis]|uniref:Lsr2 family protein n=1 Tax=Nocardioides iriomotensis TaxID=715784 RepID=A0A4Q5J7K1_9ACTN|nr:Lsr2 family protein [Nocardioides iriomotensis]RYU14493.1 Lsr2 family protein [Nocardioides iriomotensis]